MLGRFQEFITAHELCKPDDTILVTVSGGIDSAVMLDLFYKSHTNCIIAHCNFNLRGDESDGDEHFVRSLADRYEYPVYVKQFDTEKYAQDENLSIQMAARTLRYEWFEELCDLCSCHRIATAHNRDDVTETFFINLARGTGIKGLTGIREKNGRIIRPLLFAGRDEIEQYAQAEGIRWREDSSNKKTDYARNRIRHVVIPAMNEINQRFREIMPGNIERLKSAAAFYHQLIAEKKRSLLKRKGNQLILSIERLMENPHYESLLYEILSDFEFSSPVVKDICRGLQGSAGKIFLSPSFRLIKDRDYLILQPLKAKQKRRFYIENPYLDLTEPIQLKLSLENYSPSYTFPASPAVACLDYDKLNFPLLIRKWEQGDYFQPFGMSGLKKLSDFFIDNKVSIPDKEETWLVTSGKDIVWVVGMRIDGRFSVEESTSKVFKMEWIDNQMP
jgi:tRNA(Ile)-lysidine synthase